MPLSWNQIKLNATKFAQDWKNAHYEKGETQTFYNEFFEVFGHRRRNVAVYEQKVKLLNDKRGFIDLFWPGMLLVEQKSAGKDLLKADGQANDYILALKERERPRYKLVCDFQTFELTDLETRTKHAFKLAELPDKVRLFGFIAGREQQTYRDQDPANVEAMEKMSRLHKLLEDDGYIGHDLELLLVRLMFCVFADDTGIFEADNFLRYIQDRTADDGSDLGAKLVHIFEVLDTPKDRRQKSLDEELQALPYVNGQLFSKVIRTPSFNKTMREALLECCYYQWSKVSPALFGSLFQTVMLPVEQRKKGAHYTSERNILKTIRPLFLDELREEFEGIKSSRGNQRESRLRKFQDKLAKLTFLDPACGCGNFLILAYREIRLLELEVLEALHPKNSMGMRTAVLDLDIAKLSKVDVDQFYGIELEEFPYRIAEVAMWLVDHQMNMKLSDSFGDILTRLPLKASPHIFHGNALTKDWAEVLPPERCSYVLGNPPFIGKKEQGAEQKAELNAIFEGVKGKGVLDYVACWYLKAAKYIQGTNIRVAFVSTKSVSQGEQVGILWGELYRLGCRIHFAHRTFKWTIDGKKAKGMKIAAVHVVIIGFGAPKPGLKQLFEYEDVTADPHLVMVRNINPYLVEADDLLVMARRSALSAHAPEISYGSIGIDDGHLVFETKQEVDDFLASAPAAAPYIKQFLGGDEYINGETRWCLWLKDAPLSKIAKIAPLDKRVQQVKKFRLSRDRQETKSLAKTPWLFGEIRQPNKDYLLIPKVSSETRAFIPMGYCSKDIIANGSSLVVPEAGAYHFGVIQSTMHMAWMRAVGGRTKSDYQYSNSLVYNTFPWPAINQALTTEIAAKAQAVLNTRKKYKKQTLASLYGGYMPADLQKAHEMLDKAVDKAYRKQPFKTERERVEFLFGRYQALVQTATKKAVKKTKGRKAGKNSPI